MKTFNELKDLLDNKLPLYEATYEFGELADKKKFNEKDPEILVKGVGKYKLSALKKNILSKLEELIKKVKEDDFDFVNEALNQKNILIHYIKAILDIENEMQSPNIKRKITLRKKVHDQKETQRKIMNEIAPPDKDIEDWILKMKPYFKKKYGTEKGIEYLYRTAWKRFDDKKR